jgi:hypothetical protein
VSRAVHDPGHRDLDIFVTVLGDGAPVLVLRSKRGKLLLEISSRIRCPGKNTLDVTGKSMVTS